MEALAIIQGATNLLELSSLAFKLCRRFKDAPKDLELVGKHLNWLAAEIHILVELQENPLEGIFKAKETHMLFCETLLEAKRTLASVHDAITEYARKNSIGTKLQWAMLGKETVEQLMAELTHVERVLKFMVTILL